MAAGLDDLLWRYLGWVLVPLWLIAGFVDYLCHRRAGIEHTSGVHESALHALMLLEIGIPILLVLFCRVTTLVVAIGAVALLAHALTSWRDLRWSDARRRIAPLEQVAHGVLEATPFVALSLLALLHWDQVGAADFSLVWQPLPAAVITGVLAASLALAVLPFAEELLRCRRVARHATGE